MEKLIKSVDKERGIVQITTADERWYAMPGEDPATKLPIFQYVPSVTWICGFYPKGIGFYKWLSNVGWDEAQAIKEAAGGRGSKVHQAVGALLDGLPVGMEDAFPNPETKQAEPLTLEEYEAIISFAAFHRKYKPELIAKDFVVWNKEQGYAGTADYLCRIPSLKASGADDLWLIDFKTSKAVWPSHRLQVSAYRHTPEIETLMKKHKAPGIQLGILQLGYSRSAAGYKLTEIEDQFDLFLASRMIWQAETNGQSPLQRDYPVKVALEENPKLQTEQGAHVEAEENKKETLDE